MTWERSRFLVAGDDGIPYAVNGRVSRGLGLCPGDAALRWHVIHLGSGHVVSRIDGDGAYALRIAEEIANLGDWTFTALDGEHNQDPQLIGRLVQLWKTRLGVGPIGKPRHHEAAEKIGRTIALGTSPDIH